MRVKLVRSQVNMAGEEKLHSPDLKHWLCNVWSGVVEKNWPLSVDQWWLQALKFLVHLIDLLSILLRCHGFTGIQKTVVDQSSSRPPVTMTFLWCKFGFGKSFGASSWSSHWAGHCRLLYKIHFSLHVTIWSRNGSLSSCRIGEDNLFDTFKMIITSFKFVVSSWGTHLSRFFTFPICFKCLMTIELSTLSSLATSHVAVRKSALMIAFNWSLSTYDGQPLCSLSSGLLCPLQNFLNHHCTVHLFH